jgi:hypothetical protein
MSVGLPHPEAENVGAFLLGALTGAEARSFEAHLESCRACREETARLRPAAEALPRSVEPLPAPASLRGSLMSVVEAEARERQGAPDRAPLSGRARGWLASIGERLSPARPALVGAAASVALVVGLAAGVSVGLVAGEPDARTVAAQFDDRRVARGSGSLAISGDSDAGATLRVHGMPSLPTNKTYQVWLQRDGETIPKALFNVGEDGRGLTAVDADVRDADAVLVTREPAGGARSPSEEPILKVEL